MVPASTIRAPYIPSKGNAPASRQSRVSLITRTQKVRSLIRMSTDKSYEKRWLGPLKYAVNRSSKRKNRGVSRGMTAETRRKLPKYASFQRQRSQVRNLVGCATQNRGKLWYLRPLSLSYSGQSRTTKAKERQRRICPADQRSALRAGHATPP
jgi:hypothetical protein